VVADKSTLCAPQGVPHSRVAADMQPDGNLVLYQTNGSLWGSGTAGKGGTVARM